jgi:predicted nucleotidyltransferase
MEPEERIRWHRLTAEERARLRDACARVLPRAPWVIAAYLYGSAGRGERPARDLDIALLTSGPPPAWDDELRLADELADESGIHEIPFDVRLLAGADPVFQNEVLRVGARLYDRDPGARAAFEAQAMARWLDFKPVWERMCAAARARWARE